MTFPTLLDEIASQLGRPDLRTLAPEEKENEVSALIAAAPALIILDNFETIKPEEEQSNCLSFLANAASCPVLITTRTHIDNVFNIPLAAMSIEEAREFLTRLVEQTSTPSKFDKLDRDDLIQKCEANPLVLQWVVGQIDRALPLTTVLGYLARGKGDAAERVFTRSFELPQLGDDGRAVLLSLSLFVPSSSREALAEVAGLGTDLDRLDQVIVQLASLWLVGTAEDDERLMIQGLTRELAKARLSHDEHADEYRRRFVAYFLSYSDASAQPKPEEYDALEIERDNLLSAMDIAFALNEGANVMRLMEAISFDGVNGYLMMRGYWAEAITKGEQALKAARSLADDDQIARFSHNLAITHQLRGELDKAQRLYNESLELNQKLGDQRRIAVNLHNLAALAHYQGELGEARQLYNESLEIKKKLGDQRGIANSMQQLASLAHGQGELEDARRLYNESLEINKRLGDQRGIAGSLHQLAMLAQDQGELAEARRLYNESLEIAKKLGDQSRIASSLHNLAALAQDQGELEEARRLYNGSLEIKKNLGDQRGIANSMHNLAVIAQDQGKIEAARRLYNESLEIKKKLGDQRGIADSLHQLAMLAQNQGEFAEARRLYGESLEINKRLGNQSGIATSLHQLGRLAEDEGSDAEAAQLFSEALAIFEKLKSPNAKVARQNLERVKGKSS